MLSDSFKLFDAAVTDEDWVKLQREAEKVERQMRKAKHRQERVDSLTARQKLEMELEELRVTKEMNRLRDIKRVYEAQKND